MLRNVESHVYSAAMREKENDETALCDIRL